jgi:hypothetical protein
MRLVEKLITKYIYLKDLELQIMIMMVLVKMLLTALAMLSQLKKLEKKVVGI